MTIFYNKELKTLTVNVRITTLKLNSDVFKGAFLNMKYEEV